jgi:hypothetical protein
MNNNGNLTDDALAFIENMHKYSKKFSESLDSGWEVFSHLKVVPDTKLNDFFMTKLKDFFYGGAMCFNAVLQDSIRRNQNGESHAIINKMEQLDKEIENYAKKKMIDFLESNRKGI